jgi:hypothetical protein
LLASYFESMRQVFLFLSLFFNKGCLITAFAQTSLYWDMQQPHPVGVVSLLQVSSLYQGNNNGTSSFFTSLSSSQNYPGASGGLNAGLAARPGQLVTGTSGSGYFGLVLTPAAGYRIRILSVAFGSRSTSSGPARWGLFSSADQFSTSLYSSSLNTNSSWGWQSSVPLTLVSSQAIELRIYGYEGVGTAAINVTNWRIDDLTIHYQLEPISLPVQWLYVRYEVKTNGIHLFWGTASEYHNKIFQVERSFNGYTYEVINTICSDTTKVVPDTNRHYSYLDTNCNGRSVFYRIKQVDHDELFSYSNIIKISADRLFSHSVFRIAHVDLAAGRLQLQIQNSAQVKQIQLYNLNGQCVKTHPIPSVVSQADVPALLHIDISGLSTGVYYIVAVSTSYRTKGQAVLIR